MTLRRIASSYAIGSFRLFLPAAFKSQFRWCCFTPAIAFEVREGATASPRHSDAVSMRTVAAPILTFSAA